MDPIKLNKFLLSLKSICQGPDPDSLIMPGSLSGETLSRVDPTPPSHDSQGKPGRKNSKFTDAPDTLDRMAQTSWVENIAN